MEGWIKLHRKIRGSSIFNDMYLFRLWIICLTEATHKGRSQIIGKQAVQLQAGEFVTGRDRLAELFNTGLPREQQKSPISVWRWLVNLENADFLFIKSTNKYSVVSIAKWHLYQSIDPEHEQQMINKRTTDEQQMITNKNVKNVKNVKKKDNTGVPRPSQRREYAPDEPAMKLAKRLHNRILENNPDHKQPNLQRWADDIRLAIERDGRKVDALTALIDWCQQDTFWRRNILSGEKLRKHFDVLKQNFIGEVAKKQKGGANHERSSERDNESRRNDRRAELSQVSY